MAKTSFAKREKPVTDEKPETQENSIEAEAEVVEETTKPTEVAEAVGTEVGETLKQELDAPAVGGIEGDIDAEDIKLPRINLVQSTSAIADDFTPGALVLDKEVELGDETHPIQLVTLWGKKLYQQKLPFGESDESPLVFQTRKEVKEWGGTTEWSKEAIEDHRYFENLAHFVVAVRCPDEASEDLAAHFDLEIGDELWTRVAFTVNGSSYNAFGKQMITAAQTAGADGIWSRSWEVKPEKRSNARGRWFVPVPRFKGKITDPERLAFFANLAASVAG
jgi:hypothetical protein